MSSWSWVRLLLAAALCLSSCRQRSLGGPQPEASLADSTAAQAAFHALEAEWLVTPPEGRPRLRPGLERFLQGHAEDGRARRVRAYLAWVLIETGQLEEGKTVLANAAKGPAGVTHDIAQIVEAAALTRKGRPEGALALLRPLDGKLFDPAARQLFGEEYLRAALAARRYSEALDIMVDSLAEAPSESSEIVQRSIEARLPELPHRPLERGLDLLERTADDESASLLRGPARAWLARTMRARLMTLALAERDAALARRLFASAPMAVRKSPIGQQLAQLMTQTTLSPRVAGRTLGLVISVGTHENARRSAAVAAGVSRRLGLSNRARGSAAVELLTRDEAGSEEDMGHALASLASDGAVILAAAVDRPGAERARRYAEDSKLPVLLLTPAGDGPDAEYAFVLGAEPARDLLVGELAKRGTRKVAVVGGEEIPCGTESAAAGMGRFPVERWKRGGTDAIVLLGSADCSRDVLEELDAADYRPCIALGLEAGELLPTLRSEPVPIALAAGSFPHQLTPGSPPSWFEALGHDVAELVEASLRSFPTQRVDDLRAVTELHRRAQAALLGARGKLWTSSKAGFEASHTLPRSFFVVSAPASGKGQRP